MNIRVELEYKDRRCRPVQVQPTIYVDGVGFYSHCTMKDADAEAMAQVLYGELNGKIENFTIKRVRRSVQEVELTEQDLSDIRSMALED